MCAGADCALLTATLHTGSEPNMAGRPGSMRRKDTPVQWWIMAIISFTCFSSSCGHTLPSTNLRHQSHICSEQRIRTLVEP